MDDYDSTGEYKPYFEYVGTSERTYTETISTTTSTLIGATNVVNEDCIGKADDAIANVSYMRTRACLKNAFCEMCVLLCGRFAPNEGGVAGYVD